MEPSIDERLSRMEEDFLLAAAQGGSSLTAFQDRWSDLLLDLENGVRTSSVKEETIALANTIASRIAILTDYLMDFKTSADAVQGDLEGVFAQFDINDKPNAAPTEADSHAAHGNTPSSNFLDTPQPQFHALSCPLYIEPAYRWLLQNLHNPYPSKDIREAVFRETRCQRKMVDAWFVDARKRMGWNALRKQRFSNKRVDIVDAATRFFAKPDDKRPLDSNIELEFASIEKRANDLYSDKFSESTLATKLDVAVKDLTPQMKAQARAEEKRRRQATKDAVAASSYPSPERSPGRSPEPFASPLSEDDDLATTYPEAISGRKRRSSSSSRDDHDDATISGRPHKRSKLDEQSSSSAVPSAGLPSPAPSLHDHLQMPSPSPTALDLLPVSFISSRKRRLSESDGQSTPKRPRNLPIGPRMYAVSDPLPLSSALFEASRFDSWFSNDLGIPSSVRADELDPSQPLDVEVFNYSTNLQTHSIQVESSIADQHYSPEVLDRPIPSLTVDEASLTADALEISTNTFDYNELFWDLEEPPTQFSGQNLVNQPENSLLMSQTSLDYRPTEIIFFPPTDISPQTLDPSVITVPSQPYSEVPTSDFDWLFQPMVPPPQDMFGPVDKLQDYGQSIAGQDLFHVFSPLDSTSDSLSQLLLQADKAVKQRKLQEMKEATRRLEEEIAAS